MSWAGAIWWTMRRGCRPACSQRSNERDRAEPRGACLVIGSAAGGLGGGGVADARSAAFARAVAVGGAVLGRVALGRSALSSWNDAVAGGLCLCAGDVDWRGARAGDGALERGRSLARSVAGGVPEPARAGGDRAVLSLDR